jgi:hypothetical protein
MYLFDVHVISEKIEKKNLMFGLDRLDRLATEGKRLLLLRVIDR